MVVAESLTKLGGDGDGDGDGESRERRRVGREGMPLLYFLNVPEGHRCLPVSCRCIPV